MRKQTRYTLLVVVVALVALGAMLYLRLKAPPEVARLLPESDAMVYVNLKPLRAATHFDRNPVQRSQSYQQFIDATGIVAERDLDSAAFALHRMADPNGPNGVVAFTEVFEGRFDRDRLTRYLHGVAKSEEMYAGRVIYAIPSEGRTLRVAVLGYDLVAVSNMPEPEQIHSILDRARAAASPFAGSSLLEARYRDVPALASAWAVGKVGLPFSKDGQITLLGMGLPMPADATFVASVRYQGALRLRVEEIAGSEAEAARVAEALTGIVGLVQALQRAQQPVARTAEDQAMRNLLDSVKVVQEKSRMVVTATIPAESLKKVMD